MVGAGSLSRYVIYYRVLGTTLIVLRVFHGSQHR